jgi:hypothetical protein
MNFIRSPLLVHIADINRQMTEHERLVLVGKDKTAAFGFKMLDIGTLFYQKEHLRMFCLNSSCLLLLMKKDAIFCNA